MTATERSRRTASDAQAEPGYPTAALLSETRLAALDRSSLLDGSADPAFDRAVRVAKALLNAPVGLVSIVGTDRQVFRSQDGLSEPWASWGETPLSHSFCKHVVACDAPLVVGDAQTHPLVSRNLAVSELGVVAYCGVPLHSPDGEVLGALCAIDSDRRDWTCDDVARLRDLAAVLTAEIAARLRAASLDRLEREMTDRLAEITQLSAEMHHRVGNIFSVVLSVMSLSGREADEATERSLKRISDQIHSLARVHTVNEAAVDYHLVDLGSLLEAFLAPHAPSHAITMGGEPVRLPYQLVTPLGLVLHELVAQGRRSGALDTISGHVDLRWGTRDGTLTLRWRSHEAGSGDRSGTSGSDHAADACSAIILQLCTQQLDGTFERTDMPDGHEWTLTFPIERRAVGSSPTDP